MKREPDFPDNSFETAATPIEQRLRRLRPRPCDFNAEKILAAADQMKPTPAISSRSERRPFPWIAIGASGVSGLAIGILATCLVLLPQRPTPALVKQQAAQKKSPAEPAAGPATVANRRTNQSAEIEVAEAQSGDADQATESFVPDHTQANCTAHLERSTRDRRLMALLDKSGRRMPGDPPLTAGLTSKRMAETDGAGGVDVAITDVFTTATDRASRDVTSPTPFVNAAVNQLLEELLENRHKPAL